MIPCSSAVVHVFDAAADRQTVLCQTDAAAPQVGLDLLMLHAVEAVPVEQCRKTLRGLRSIAGGARQHVIEQVLHHAG